MSRRSASEHAYCVLLTGTRRDPLLGYAIELARARGVPFGVFARSRKEAKAIEQRYQVPASSARGRAPRDWRTYVFADAQRIPAHLVIRRMGDGRDVGARMLIAGVPPDRKVGMWLMRLRASLRCPVLDFAQARRT